MKLTGIALMILAVGVLGYLLVATIAADQATPTGATAQSQPVTGPPLAIPVAVAVVAGGGGLFLYMFGGRGYSVNSKPGIQPVESRVVTNSVHVSA